MQSKKEQKEYLLDNVISINTDAKKKTTNNFKQI
jgi:hypothetical protein